MSNPIFNDLKKVMGIDATRYSNSDRKEKLMPGFMPDLTAPEQAPPGALPREVADDVPAMLSDGEYVVPADVLRWHGMKTFEEMRQEAKMGFLQMEDEGRLQGPGMAQEEPPEEDSYPGSEEDMDSPEFNLGGFLSDYPEFASGGLLMAPETYASYMSDYGSPGEKEAPDRVSDKDFAGWLSDVTTGIGGIFGGMPGLLGLGYGIATKGQPMTFSATLMDVARRTLDGDAANNGPVGPSSNAAIGTNEATTEARDAAYGGSWSGGDDSDSSDRGNESAGDPSGPGEGGPGDSGDSGEGW